ncbi:DASH family cryptochrome [Pseudomonas sp. CFBP 13711]|uniref:DASH family cryptochrome n=1 Tax=unclassified Pseudomonas TaxID=196821 RepID=UPI0017846C11|nr:MULTISPECIES: DASH family cryptochrome [unclassified Pseudomonas]MBD8707589.1 DASH family cryptochrome [Pseudomonas sp. CFBP 13711]MBD8713113.1 DASH family cryptochrome [Pseudomonas sp. CFBP 13715]
MNTLIYWFRQDLRLADNPAFTHACEIADTLLPVYCAPVTTSSPWGFERIGAHRQYFEQSAVSALAEQLRAHGSGLMQIEGDPVERLVALAHEWGIDTVICERIAAPEEEAQVQGLRAAGLTVEDHWQSTLFSLDELPMAVEELPDVFSSFRRLVEKAHTSARPVIPSPTTIPALPPGSSIKPVTLQAPPALDSRSAFAYQQQAFHGGEQAAIEHLQQYFSRGLANSYKATRNNLSAVDDSTKFSPWLARGSLSAPQIDQALKAFEAEHGANDSTYWIYFELLWRDYFRLLHLKYGRLLYRASGLKGGSEPGHNPQGFARWCRGETGEALIDAGMRELAATGYLSNRMRQIVASYLIFDLKSDWRAGAAWFEAQLVDYDVYSNQGNWLYIAGYGTDPRGGRRFNTAKQADEHDADGAYRRLWA